MSRLKIMREASGMSQSELARASGVNVRLIQHYEQGVRDINKASVITVLRLADALKCDIRYILNAEEEAQ